MVIVIVLASGRASADEALTAQTRPLAIEAVGGRPARDRASLETGLGKELAITFADDASLRGPLLVYLGGIAMADLPIRRALDRDRTIIVSFQRLPSNDAAWRKLLGGSLFGRDEISLAVGAAGDPFMVSGPIPFHLSFRTSRSAIVCSALLLFLFVTASWAGIRGGMLNDAGPGTSMSLGRFQLFVWTVLVVISFLVIWAVTGAADTITSQSLVLMGISAATAMGATVVESNKRPEAARELAAIRAEKGVSGATDLAAAINRSPYAPSRVLVDLLHDGNGWSLHRVQVLTWTLVLATLFIVGVYRDLAMPQFSDTLLALMGVSGGVYVGFKLNEV